MILMLQFYIYCCLVTICLAGHLRAGGIVDLVSKNEFSFQSVDPTWQVLCDIIDSIDVSDTHPEWICESSNTSSAYCSWTGITCSGSAIINVTLTNGAITGSLPSSIGNLSALEVFDLGGNALFGTLPDSICLLPSLLLLKLNDNLLSGTIPGCMLAMVSPQEINFNSNQFEGSLPSALGSSSLMVLEINDNHLTGLIPTLPDQLLYFDLSTNALTGHLPNSSLPFLEYLILNVNMLSGGIATTFTSMPSLVYFEISNNLIGGVIPENIQNLSSLSVFGASSNRLTGSIPSGIAQPYLTVIALNDNQLTGSIPPGLTSCLSLWYFYLLDNQLTGTLPALYGAYLLDVSNNRLSGSLPCGSVFSFSMVLKNNQFSGSVPDCFQEYQLLNILDLSMNQLTGTIPSLIELPNLAYYDLSRNLVHGSIPQDFDDSPSLIYIGLAGNGLTGTISNSLGSSGTLVYLILAENKLSGGVPASAQYLRALNVTQNNLTGPVIPPSWHANSTIGLLLLSHNALTGTIPSVACSFVRLLKLQVSHNNLDSDSCYPSCLKLFDQDFYSSIPRCHGDQDIAMCELADELSIASKQSTVVVTTTQTIASPLTSEPYSISQTISVANAFEYQVSFLGYTVFSLNDYMILSWEGGSVLLTDHNHTFPGYGQDVLKIQASEFSIVGYTSEPAKFGFSMTITTLSRGSGWVCVNETRTVGGVDLQQMFAYPCSGSSRTSVGWTGVTCSRDQVTGLSLRGLALTGTIPSSLSLLSSVTSIDISFNSLRGPIPSQLNRLSALSTLDLSSNGLTGTLPASLASLQLSYLSVANNKLNGSVPSFLGSMTYLSVIRLDANQFSGKLTNDVCEVPLSKRSISVVNTDLACFESCWEQFAEQPSLFAHDASLEYCAPTSYPTSTPSAPSSRPTAPVSTETNGLPHLDLIVGLVAAGLVVVFAIVLFGFYKFVRTKVYPSPESVELMNMLRTCPIHKAVFEKTPLTPEFVSANIESSTKLTPDGRTALDMILDAGEKCDANAVVVYLLLDHQLPDELKNSKTADSECMNNNKAWGRMVQQHDTRSLVVVEKVLEAYRPSISILAYGMDEFGRKFIHIASAKCKEAINRVLYLHQRYELDGPAEHQTSTSILRFAFDHKRIIDSHGVRVAKKVALKFMANAGSFQREVYRRAINSTMDSSDFFLAVYESYDGDRRQDPEHMAFRDDAISKGYEEYPYCIVMEAAESNLDRVLNSRRIAGSDWEEIRRIYKQIVASVAFLHRHEVIHGDIKPSNVVVLSNSAVRIIDFDNSTPFGAPPTGKSSTAYCPPEHFEIVDKMAVNKDITESHPSHDMWALGALLYLLCTGVSLFFCDIDDNIADSDDMMALCQWDDAVRERKLNKITDKLARNLVSLMLTKNVERRIDALHALEHPFLTGKQVIRLSGEKSEFDVFISYRVLSDAHHAKLLYDELTAKGLSVWLDSQCLKSGKNWEKGFCEGLFKSDYVVCLVSKEGMRNETTDSLNWAKLCETSHCDNVMLEWMLAIELQHRSLIKGVFPVFVGNTRHTATTYDKFYLNGRDLPDVSVTTIEDKLKHHLDREGCGLPYNLKYSVRAVVEDVVSNQGAFLSGELDDAMKAIVEKIEGMVRRS